MSTHPTPQQVDAWLCAAETDSDLASALAAEVRRLREENERVKEALGKFQVEDPEIMREIIALRAQVAALTTELESERGVSWPRAALSATPASASAELVPIETFRKLRAEFDEAGLKFLRELAELRADKATSHGPETGMAKLSRLVHELAAHVREIAHEDALAYELRINGEGHAGVFTHCHPLQFEKVNLRAKPYQPAAKGAAS